MDFSRFSDAQASRLLELLSSHMGAAARSPRAVHHLRVAIRRLRQALPKPCPEIRRPLKKIMTQAGAVRDCDIALELIAGSKAEDAPAVSAKLRARRAAARNNLAALCREWPSRKVSIPLRKAGGSATVEQAARRTLPRLAREFLREGHRAGGPKASAKHLHKFRLAAKKFRYTLELFAGCYGPAADQWLEQLKATQTLLGEIIDCAASQRLLQELGAGTELIQALKRRRKRRTRAFHDAWESAAEEFEKWIGALSHPHRSAAAPRSA